MKNLANKSLEFSKFYFSKPVSVVMVSAYSYILVLVIAVLGINTVIKNASKDSISVPALGNVSTTDATSSQNTTPNQTNRTTPIQNTPKNGSNTKEKTEEKSTESSQEPAQNSAPKETIEYETITYKRPVVIEEPNNTSGATKENSKKTTNSTKTTEKMQNSTPKEYYENQNAPELFSSGYQDPRYYSNDQAESDYLARVAEAKTLLDNLLLEKPDLTRSEAISSLRMNGFTYYEYESILPDYTFKEESQEENSEETPDNSSEE